MLAVDEALEKLAAHDKTKAELVKLLYFVGLTIPEAASILGLSEPTAKRYWAYARAWLLATIESSR
jgi:DNA-directed RNA polymerase specialized sigma24 family protein